HPGPGRGNRSATTAGQPATTNSPAYADLCRVMTVLVITGWDLIRRWNGLPDRAPLDRVPRRRFESAVENLRVQIHLAGPLDRARLWVDPDPLKYFAPFVNRSKDPTGREHLAEVDLLH